MPRAQRLTYADRVHYYLLKNDLDAFNLDDLVEDVVRKMEEHGETITRCTRGCIRAYAKSLRIHKLLSKHPSNGELIQLSKKLKTAIDRIRKSDFVEVDYSNIVQISSLLRAAAGRLKSLTAGELRDRVIELLDELDALQVEYNDLKKKYEELQVDRDMALEERDEVQRENYDLKVENVHLKAVNAELRAASTTRDATPARESSSANLEGFHTAPSSPQLSQQQPASGNLSRVPTEIISPVTPPRASVSRNPSGLPTPPTTDARRTGRKPLRNDSRSGSSSHHSFRDNTPGAASIRGATPGSPSRPPHRHSPPLRQLSSQNQNQVPSCSGLTREPSYSTVRARYRDYKLLAQRQFDEQCVHIERLEEEAVQRYIEHLKHVERHNALENERRMLQEELTVVRAQLEHLRQMHLVKTQEYQDLLGQYTALYAQLERVNGMIKTFAGEATTLLDAHNITGMGATTGGPA